MKEVEFVKKYTMILVLILVTAFFAWQTEGKILLPQNINNLIAQNAYVFVLATGMLLCILTLGIGILFLSPYMMTAQAAFYQDVRSDYEMKTAEAGL